MIRPFFDAVERLEGLRVSDAMSRYVKTIRASSTMGEAAEILYQAKATGAPVVDEKGRCIGVLSLSDFLRFHHLQHAHPPTEQAGEEYQLVEHPSDSTLAVRHVNEQSVREQMSPAVQTIGPRAPLLLAARVMCAEHIHRLIVLDKRARPIGIVTTLDLAAALIKAVNEQRRGEASESGGLNVD